MTLFLTFKNGKYFLVISNLWEITEKDMYMDREYEKKIVQSLWSEIWQKPIKTNQKPLQMNLSYVATTARQSHVGGKWPRSPGEPGPETPAGEHGRQPRSDSSPCGQRRASALSPAPGSP